MPRYGTTLPRSLDSLTRPELAARWYVLRSAIDDLQAHRDRDGGEHFACIGKMRVEEMELEHRLGVYGAHGVMPPPPEGVTTEHIASRWEQIAVEITKAVLQSRGAA